MGSFTQPSSMYNVGDIVTLKSLNNLQKIKNTSKERKTAEGFYINSGLFINNGMIQYLNKKFKIREKIKNVHCSKGIGYKLENLKNEIYEDFYEKIDSWTWDETCFDTNKQLELEF